MVLSHSFSVDETSFLLKLVIASFFSIWSKSSRLKSKSFTFFGSIAFHLAATHWNCLRRRDWSNQFELRFKTIHCSCNMLTSFSHTDHTREMTVPYFCYLFQYYPKFVEWVLYWLRFSPFSSDDTVFTSWKVMVLQRLKPSWFIVTICFTILMVTKFFAT